MWARVFAALALWCTAASAQPDYEAVVMADNPSYYVPFSDPNGTCNATELVRNHWTYPVWGAQEGLGAPGVRPGTTAWHYDGPRMDSAPIVQYWQIGNTPPIRLDAPYSIEIWHKSDIPTELLGQSLVERVAAYSSDFWDHPWAGGGYSLSTRYYSGGYKTAVCGAGLYDCLDLESSTYIPADKWTHIVATFDDTTLAMYLDGVLDTLTTTTRRDLPWPQDGPLRIGTLVSNQFWCEADPASGYCNLGPFHGSLQHLALYKHALTPDRIGAHYQTMTAPMVSVQSAPEAETTFKARQVSGATVFTIPGAGRLTIVDVTGRRVHSVRLERGEYRWEPPGSGVYFARWGHQRVSVAVVR